MLSRKQWLGFEQITAKVGASVGLIVVGKQSKRN